MTEITKSLKKILDERISSPFYGSLIVSWLLWNWKIPYVTFFIDQTKLNINKIDYIITNCNHHLNLWIGPLISTAFIILVIPYLTNGAYLITLKFDTWRINMKNAAEIKRKQLITENTYKEELGNFLNGSYSGWIDDFASRADIDQSEYLVEEDILNYFIAYELIEHLAGKRYKLNEKGRYFLKRELVHREQERGKNIQKAELESKSSR